jgi:hypothetical protein
MSKPDTVPTWATDDNYSATGEDFDGTPTKVDPGAGQRAQGFAPGFRPPARWWNWWSNKVGEWFGWIDGHLSEDSGRLQADNGLTVVGTFVPPQGYLLRGVETFTADGTWTRPAGVRAVRVTVVGGGGGGGGAAGGSGAGAAGGGGGGGATVKWITSPGASESVTVGAGGGGGSAGNNSGTGGNASSFGAHCSAGGGSAGLGSTNSTSGVLPRVGGQGGIGADGDLNIRGSAGGTGVVVDGVSLGTGSGGGTVLAGQQQQLLSPVRDASPYGGGGPGAIAGGSSVAGVSGATGVVIVEEYV